MLFWKHWSIFFILIYLKHVYVLYVLINTVKNTVIKWSEDSTVKKCQNKSLAQARSLLLCLCTGRWLPLRVNPRSLWRLPLSAPSALPVLLGPCHLGQPSPVLQSLSPLLLSFSTLLLSSWPTKARAISQLSYQSVVLAEDWHVTVEGNWL